MTSENTTTCRHQFGFGFMRGDTGGQRVHSFWGTGTNIESCKKDAFESARAYAYQYECELNEKARARNRSMYAPSHIDVRIVNCSLWK